MTEILIRTCYDLVESAEAGYPGRGRGGEKFAFCQRSITRTFGRREFLHEVVDACIEAAFFAKSKGVRKSINKKRSRR